MWVWIVFFWVGGCVVNGLVARENGREAGRVLLERIAGARRPGAVSRLPVLPAGARIDQIVFDWNRLWRSNTHVNLIYLIKGAIGVRILAQALAISGAGF